jgi:hypothetical protein
VFGKPGSGKTTLLKTLIPLGEPILFLSVEAGHLVLKNVKVDMIDMTVDDNGKLLPAGERLKALRRVYTFLQTDEARNKYKWIFIDSLTEIAQNIVEGLQSDPKYQDEKMALRMWGVYTQELKTLIKAFRDLPHYNVVVTALAEEDKDEMGSLVTGVMMQGKISQQVPAWFDEVFYLSARKDKEGKEIRKLLTSATDRVIAKDRSGALEQLEEPDLAKVVNKIRGEK